MCKTIIIIVISILFENIGIVHSFDVKITHDGPIVQGGTITFIAKVYDGDSLSSGIFEYSWRDSAIPNHTKNNKSEQPTDTWVVTYNASLYAKGMYSVEVEVKKCYYYLTFICPEWNSDHEFFEISDTLHGHLEVQQKNKTRQQQYVSSSETATHIVHIKKTDEEYIKHAPEVLTYWFVDCVYYGITSDFEFLYNYTKPDVDHTIEALVVADFTPLPPPTTTMAPTTSTEKPNVTTTTSRPSTKSPVITTTPHPNNVTTASSNMKNNTIAKDSVNVIKTVSKREAKDNMATKNLTSVIISTNPTEVRNVTSLIKVIVNGTLVPYNSSFPYVCNGSRIEVDKKKSYGYFRKKVSVRAPVSKVNVSGTNWLQQGELLRLKVSCKGSANIQYCTEFIRGAYNATGNETCDTFSDLEICEFNILRYIAETMQHTILIIIKNDVSKIVTPITVTVYEVKKQAQLSVIVVPVASSLVAVVLIVFGVAYYFQNRSRFVIEVADFNFGKQYSDMEYKTFRERLRDSIVNAFTRPPSPSTSEVPVWPPGRKYGSMT